MDAEFKRWELTNWDQKSDMNQYDNIKNRMDTERNDYKVLRYILCTKNV